MDVLWMNNTTLINKKCLKKNIKNLGIWGIRVHKGFLFYFLFSI